jgi:hypothetical protein
VFEIRLDRALRMKSTSGKIVTLLVPAQPRFAVGGTT